MKVIYKYILEGIYEVYIREINLAKGGRQGGERGDWGLGDAKQEGVSVVQEYAKKGLGNTKN